MVSLCFNDASLASLDFRNNNKILGGIFVSKRLEGLYRRRMDLRNMVIRATTNGEKAERIELLESELARIESLIDQENLRLYGGAVHV